MIYFLDFLVRLDLLLFAFLALIVMQFFLALREPAGHRLLADMIRI